MLNDKFLKLNFICTISVLFLVNVIQGQTPGTVSAFQSPFNKVSTFAANVEYGHNNNQGNDLSYYGIRGLVDLLNYRLEMSVGSIHGFNEESGFSFNMMLSKNLGNPIYDKVDQYAFFVGFGYASLPEINTSSNSMLNIPLGFTLGLDIGAPAIDVNISIAPRIHYRIINSDSNFNALGGGLGLGTVLRKTGGKLGLRLGLDFLLIEDVSTEQAKTEITYSLGIQYLLKKGL